jgi:hypothetical protein
VKWTTQEQNALMDDDVTAANLVVEKQVAKKLVSTRIELQNASFVNRDEHTNMPKAQRNDGTNLLP